MTSSTSAERGRVRMTDMEIEEFENWLAVQNSGGPENGPDMEQGGDPEIPW